MTDRSHLSIGEVLSLLRDEFPDVTISKIRFLESQGLVDPERTPSGYRKFYDHDVERLRWILRQQRENFLPLKVIKGRLIDGDDTAGLEADELASSVELNGDGDDHIPRKPDEGASPIPASATAVPPGSSPPVPASRPLTRPSPPRILERPPPGGVPDPPETPWAPSPPGALRALDPGGDPSSSSDAAAWSPMEADLSAHRIGPALPPLIFGQASTPGLAGQSGETPSGADESFTREELIARSGLVGAQIDELTRFGLIVPQSSSGGDKYYDSDAMAIATASAGFARHGVEARHLRAWRTAAEREVSLFEQVVVPLLRQRNPRARAQAAANLDELAALGAILREVLVRRALGEVR